VTPGDGTTRAPRAKAPEGRVTVVPPVLTAEERARTLARWFGWSADVERRVAAEIRLLDARGSHPPAPPAAAEP
jgi:hypothetical protein